MFRSTNLSPKEFARKFPPGGNEKTSAQGAPSEALETKGGNTHRISKHPILNDIPTAATSCLIYNYEDLKDDTRDSTYPIPKTEEFQALRELKSLEAVVKRMSDGNTVFSHMLVSPADVLNLFGESFMKEMKEIQRDVS